MRKLAYENGLKKGPWTEEEDLKLIQYVNTHGPGKWRALPKKAGLQRCGKSCRLRWTNYLRPDIKRGRFSFEEEESIIQLHRVLGNKWSAIAARLPGRTDNEIKNYWNTHIRKRLHRKGIDPVTHTPRVEFSEVSSELNSALLYLSNLFNLQTLVNPTVLTLSALLASSSPSNKQNQELFLNNHINPVNPNPNKQNPYFTSSPANFPSTQNLNQRHLTQTNDSPYLTKNLENVKVESNQDILMRTFLIDDCFTAPKFSNQSTAQASEKSSFHPSNSENTIPICQNFNYDSVLSSPMSNPTPLISSPTFINNSSTEDERESYCSNLFKLDIQESFEFNDFL